MKTKITLLFLLLLISLLFVPTNVMAQSEVEEITGINETEVEENDRVMQDISNEVRLVNTNYENNMAVITIQADRSTTLEIIYPRENKRMGRFDVSVDKGTTEIVLTEQYDQVAIWDGGDGLQVDIRGTGILNEILAGATSDNLQHSAAGGAAGALIAVVVYFYRAKNKLLNGFSETIWGFERINIDKKDKSNVFLEKLYSITNIQWLIIAILSVGVIYYFGLSINDIPIWVYVFITAMIGLSVISYAFVPTISKKLNILQPDEELILEIDAGMTDPETGEVNMKVPAKNWVCHPELAEKVEIKGEKRTPTYRGKTMHVVNHFYPEKLEADASDIMSVPDEQLLAHLEAIEEHKARSNTVKYTFIRVMRNLKNITDKVEMKHHLELDSKERDLGTYKGDMVSEVLKDEVDEYEKLLGGETITEKYKELKEELDEGAVKNTGESK